MTFADVLLILLYLMLILTLTWTYTRFSNIAAANRGLFLKGLLAKLLGGISFFLVYTFYYSYGGDSKSYFKSAEELNNILSNDFVEYFKILFADSTYMRMEHFDLLERIPWGADSSEWVMVKFTSVVSLFGMRNYFVTTLLFASLSYAGIWRFFQVFQKRYPRIQKQTAIGILFVPSVFFWGSGIMKDCVVIGFLGLVMYNLQLLIDRKSRFPPFSIVLLIISAYIIFKIKAYVVVSLVPALVIWMVMEFKGKIRNNFIRKAIAPFFIVAAGAGVLYSVTILGQYNERYSLDGVLNTAKGMQTWHYVEGDNFGSSHGRGSSYSLGDYDPTLLGTLGQFFPAVNVTLFRPYLTEAKSPVMVAAAIESLLVLLYTLYVIIGLGPARLYRVIAKDAFLLMCISFALFFAFAVGFTSYNFGALVRYKIPCIPFYLCSLAILSDAVKQIKEQKARLRSDNGALTDVIPAYQK